MRANINAETARYDALATELAALRQELTGVASLPLNSPDTVASAPAASAPQITYIPGAGVAIPLGESQLNIAAEVSLLAPAGAHPYDELALAVRMPDAAWVDEHALYVPAE